MTVEDITKDIDVLEGLGYAPVSEQHALLGEVMKLEESKRMAVIPKILRPKNVGGANLNARDEAIRRIGGLPHDIQKAILSKKLQLADSSWYVVKPANAVSNVRMFESDDDKGVGVGNIAKRQLDKDYHFLLVGIQLLSGVNANPLLASFDTIPLAVANGDFEFKSSDNKYVVPKDTSCNVFLDTQKTNERKGFWKLDNPKWLEPQSDLTFDIRFSTATAANTNLKLVLYGVTVINY